MGIDVMQQMLKFGSPEGEAAGKINWNDECKIVEIDGGFVNTCDLPASRTSDTNSICPLNTVVQNDMTYQDERITGENGSVTQNCGFANYRCTTYPEECYGDMTEAARRRWFFQNTNCCSSTGIQVFKESLSWDDAKSACEAKGGMLAHPRTQADVNTIIAMAPEIESST